MLSALALILFGRLPRMESYFSRCANVFGSVRSLTATNSRLGSLSDARKTLRPMRPNPLMPTLIAIVSPFYECVLTPQQKSAEVRHEHMIVAGQGSAVNDACGIRKRCFLLRSSMSRSIASDAIGKSIPETYLPCSRAASAEPSNTFD